MPIEGEWFTGTFRDAVFGLPSGSRTKIVTISAYDIVKTKDKAQIENLVDWILAQ